MIHIGRFIYQLPMLGKTSQHRILLAQIQRRSQITLGAWKATLPKAPVCKVSTTNDRNPLDRRTFHSADLSQLRRYCSSSSLPGKKASLVIFDKDGTLMCIGHGYSEFVQKLSNSLDEEIKPGLGRQVLGLLGYNPDLDEWTEGLWVDTDDLLRKGVTEFLLKEGVDEETASDFGTRSVATEKDFHAEHVKALGDPKGVMESLKQFGVKIAVCTSDSRPATITSLKALGVLSLVDYVLCGDDEEMIPKPKPDNIWTLCQHLDVAANETVMVGDSSRDSEMAKAAGVQAVGVTSGVSSTEKLKSFGCDHVIENISSILSIVLPENHEEMLAEQHKKFGSQGLPQPKKFGTQVREYCTSTVKYFLRPKTSILRDMNGKH